MCGICGFYDQRSISKENKQRLLAGMLQTLVHRGPDDSGLLVDGPVGLGNRRLSIIDLAGGHQPIANEDKSIWCVQNGEIYNYKELADDLAGRGHKFCTQSDTEVLVHLFEEYGMDMVHKLEGMFALAVWNTRKHELFLARDPFGIKPLYYANLDKLFLFGSELKSLLPHPALPRELDLEALSRYMMLEYVPTPYSIFKHIRKLPPGHFIILRQQELRIKEYWDVPLYSAEDFPVKKNSPDVCEHLDAELKKSVENHMVSDVPVGALLSGGIDSSLISALAGKNTLESIKSFTIGFEESSFDETHFARQAANHLGTDHMERQLSSTQALTLVEELADIFDEPFSDNSIIPTYWVCKLAREKVKVVLSGDGGDELFAGYPTYQAHYLAQWYERLIPQSIHRTILQPLASRLPASTGNISLDFKIKKFMDGVWSAPEIRHHLWLGPFVLNELDKIWSEDVREYLTGDDPFREVKTIAAKAAHCDVLTQAQYIDLKLYLADEMLVKTDRTSMACSLEVRVPFLNKNIANLAFSMAPQLRIKRLQTKYGLKRVARSYLPKSIVDRPKKGFGTPVAKWIKGDLREMIGDLLSYDRISRASLFNPDYVTRLVNEHWKGTADHRQKLWALLMFEQWKEHWLDGYTKSTD